MKKYIVFITLLSTLGATHAKKIDCFDCEEKKDGIRASRFECEDERIPAYKRRDAAACLRNILVQNYCITCEENGDGKNVPYFAAKYSKGLQHGPDGILTQEGQRSYEKLVKALNNGCQKTYNSFQLAQNSVRKLVSPQGSATFNFMGGDSAMSRMASFPKLCSKEAAAQLLEVYLLAIARDVTFSEYGTGQGSDKDPDGQSITGKAALVLTDFGTCYQGPVTSNGTVTPELLFRGNNQGSLYGPYISQFLYLPMSIPIGAFPPEVGMQNLPLNVFEITQQRPIPSTKNFGITLPDFTAIQNGQVPIPYSYGDYNDSTKRYLSTGRDLAGLVHFDYPYEAYYNALRVLAAHGFPFSPNSPYQNGTIKNSEAFVNFGPIDVFGLIGTATQEAIKAAWAHKWRGNRVLRPEALAGLVQITKGTKQNTFGLNNAIFTNHNGINVLDWVKNINNAQGSPTYLLPLVYPEGSPQHPSYPAGHATVAGACITIIKAIFDDRALISDYAVVSQPDPTDPTQLIPYTGSNHLTMTVGSELDKLASNISIGRNFAGVHYRADGDLGMTLGEQVAIKVLQDHAACLTEQTFNGFELTKLDGTRILITAKKVEVIY